jgi:hypothetical protein
VHEQVFASFGQLSLHENDPLSQSLIPSHSQPAVGASSARGAAAIALAAAAPPPTSTPARLARKSAFLNPEFRDMFSLLPLSGKKYVRSADALNSRTTQRDQRDMSGHVVLTGCLRIPPVRRACPVALNALSSHGVFTLMDPSPDSNGKSLRRVGWLPRHSTARPPSARDTEIREAGQTVV